MLVSVSMSHDKTSERHSKRDYTPMNVAPSLSERNVRVIDSPSYQDAFNDIFADAIDDYNARQTRPDRKRSHDYWSDVEAAYKAAKSEKPNVPHTTYTYVLQLGDRNTLGVTDDGFDVDHWTALKAEDPEAAAAYVDAHLNDSEERANAKRCLTEFVKTLPERYPQFWFIEIIGHDDEPNGTFHFDLTFVPVGEGYKTGMSMRDSLTKALNMMGFRSNKTDGLAIDQWQEDVKRQLCDFMAEYGFEREYKDSHEKHRSIGAFQMEQRLDQLAQDIETSELAVADAERHMLDAMDREADIINEASEATAELEVARRARRDAEEDARKAREKADDAERRAVAAKQQVSKSIETANENARRINEAANKEAARIRQRAKDDVDAAAENRRKTKTALDDAKTLLDESKTISEDERKLRESVKTASRPQAHESLVSMVLRKAGDVIATVIERHGQPYEADSFRTIWKKHVAPNVRAIAKGIAAAVWPTEAQRKVTEEMQRQSDAQREMSAKLAALRPRVQASEERTAISEEGYDWHEGGDDPQMG